MILIRLISWVALFFISHFKHCKINQWKSCSFQDLRRLLKLNMWWTGYWLNWTYASIQVNINKDQGVTSDIKSYEQRMANITGSESKVLYLFILCLQLCNHVNSMYNIYLRILYIKLEFCYLETIIFHYFNCVKDIYIYILVKLM